MKKQILGVSLAGLALLIFLSLNEGEVSSQDFPEEIASILKSSCYDCHSEGAKSDKALKAVQFDQWDDYRLTKS